MVLEIYLGKRALRQRAKMNQAGRAAPGQPCYGAAVVAAAIARQVEVEQALQDWARH